MHHGLAANFWAEQPRVTSKSGWITHGASHSSSGRAGMQIAACKLGIAIVGVVFEATGDQPGGEH